MKSRSLQRRWVALASPSGLGAIFLSLALTMLLRDRYEYILNVGIKHNRFAAMARQLLQETTKRNDHILRII